MMFTCIFAVFRALDTHTQPGIYIYITCTIFNLQATNSQERFIPAGTTYNPELLIREISACSCYIKVYLYWHLCCNSMSEVLEEKPWNRQLANNHCHCCVHCISTSAVSSPLPQARAILSSVSAPYPFYIQYQRVASQFSVFTAPMQTIDWSNAKPCESHKLYTL